MNQLKQYLIRNKSCLNDQDDLEPLYSHKLFPVYFGVSEEDESQDIFAEMNWAIQKSTGVIQLSKLIPLEILYQSQHAFGVGVTWEQHYEQFSDFILNQGALKVLDIGGGQGKIATICTRKKSDLTFTIVDPNPFIESTSQIRIVKGFFGDVSIDEDFDTYSFSHVLEHIYDPIAFLKVIHSQMKSDDKLVFSYPNLQQWLKNKFTNALNFEHTLYLNESHLETMLHNVGFEIVNKKYFQSHSYFYSLKKCSEKLDLRPYQNCYLENRKLFTSFIEHYKSDVQHLNSLISASQNPVFLFGAHIFSQYLAVAGLNISDIEMILDNSTEKQDKRLYGTHLRVQSPNVLKQYESPVVILRAGPYNDEIRKDILENINPATLFI